MVIRVPWREMLCPAPGFPGSRSQNLGILGAQRGDDTFIQDFSEAGSDTVTDFNPAFDTIDFRGLGGVDSISVNPD